MKQFTPTEYELLNVATGNHLKDEGWTLADSSSPVPSLVRTVYSKSRLDVKGDDWGFYRFADWLPIHRLLKDSATTVTYRSEKIARELGLEHLYISFSGYWPEKGAFMRTCSFKETEAYSVCGRIPLDNRKILVVASAGNTARAFAKVCSDNDIPLLLCIPEDNIDALYFERPLNECVKIVSSPRGSDYFDAITLSQIAGESDMFMDEGGAKNVARRDGMGTTVLSAATVTGRIPDAYFQAVGSGTGGIAAWEASMRLAGDGRFGNNKMRLFLMQNHPFTPMYDAWRAQKRELFPVNDDNARVHAGSIVAKVLSNRKPPYSIAGGVFDALSDTCGSMESVTNDEASVYLGMFERLEGVDIHPAAAVALAGLHKAVQKGEVGTKDIIMLNITGGGEKLFKSENKVYYAKPSAVIPLTEDRDTIIRKIENLFR